MTRTAGLLLKLFRLLPVGQFRRALRFGTGAAIEHIPFLGSHAFATVIDAGANRGQFSLVARYTQPLARILAFEPLQKPFDAASALFAGDEGFGIFPLALGSADAVLDMNVSRQIDSSSILTIGSEQTRFWPGTAKAGSASVRVRRLDDVLADRPLAGPVLLKIDVQGFELELLKGAQRSLARIDDIYVELSFRPFYEGQPLASEVVEWLRDHGFRLAGVYNVVYARNGEALQSDVHFRRAGG